MALNLALETQTVEFEYQGKKVVLEVKKVSHAVKNAVKNRLIDGAVVNKNTEDITIDHSRQTPAQIENELILMFTSGVKSLRIGEDPVTLDDPTLLEIIRNHSPLSEWMYKEVVDFNGGFRFYL